MCKLFFKKKYYIFNFIKFWKRRAMADNYKKHAINRKKLESYILRDLQSLYAQGTFFDTCLEKDGASSKKFQIAKKRYSNTLSGAENTIRQIRDFIKLMENENLKEQKAKNLAKKKDEE